MKHPRGSHGFTLVEVLAVLIIIAILAGVGTPIYLRYVESARAADAQTTIGAIVTAEKIHYQRFGKYTSLQELEDKRMLTIDPSTKHNWTFSVVAGNEDFSAVKAISTDEMPGGAGKTVDYIVQTGKFSGYSFDD